MMQPKHFCTHAIESLDREWATLALPGMSQKMLETINATTKECCVLLDRAEKFMLPEWGRIFDHAELDVLGDAPTLNRLPYPVIAAEYVCDYSRHNTMGPGEMPSTRRISLNVEHAALVAFAPVLLDWIMRTKPLLKETSQLDIGFVTLPICYFEPSDLWLPPPAIAVFRKDGRSQEHMAEIIVTPLGQDAYDSFPLMQRLERATRDVNDECVAAVHLLLALSLERVTHTTIEAPVKLNRKRARKAKPPLYDYKVLDIVSDLSGTPRESVGRPHGKHASPRMHKRRGHIRRLASGNFTWVRNTIVGKPGAGSIEKDYAVKHK